MTPARPGLRRPDPRGRRRARIATAVAVALAVLAGPVAAQTLGDMAEKATESIDAIGPLLASAFYVIGLVVIGWALLRLRQHFNQPDRNLLSGAVAGVIIAVGLFLTPALINNLAGSLNLQQQQLEKPKF